MAVPTGILLLAGSLAACVAARADGSPGPPPPAPEVVASLESIVVTARRRRDDAFSVPLALSVIREGSIAVAGVDDLASLVSHVPGLSFESGWGGQAAAPVLRGQSQPSTAGDNVGVFVDGVYQASRAALDAEPLDLARIEVVRGPQNALFGQSTFAGAIHYVPRLPGEVTEAGLRMDAGSAAYVGAQGFISGPLGASTLRVRLAASHRAEDGTQHDAEDGRPIGGFRRDAAALTLVAGGSTEPGDAGGSAEPGTSLSLRYLDASSGQPPMTSLDGADYNCGARDTATGWWSYRCGPLPIGSRFTVSPGVPDSTQRTLQAALRGRWPLGDSSLAIDVTGYRADSRGVRDFDAGSGGMTAGVCLVASTCAAVGGGARFVERLVQVNVVSVGAQHVDQGTFELRASGAFGGGNAWMLGAFAARTHERASAWFGADGSLLAAGEQLAALLPATPQRVGPLSLLNRALVSDPNRQQVLQSRSRTGRGSVALFGSVDLALAPSVALRGELRWTHEREQVDILASGFGPGPGSVVPAQGWDDVTPGVNLSWRATPANLLWWSVSKGSRAGGVNTTLGLDPVEQRYAPESNWTTEFGWRSARAGGSRSRLRSLSLVGFYIDWRDAQILGFATTPGVSALITRNTAGIFTHGVEASLEFEVVANTAVELAYSYVDPRFRASSEDLGARGFCGISGASVTSSFCVIGPSRNSGVGPGLLVPYVDGNVPNRTPRHTLNAGLRIEPRLQPAGWVPSLRINAGWQGNIYERAVNGAEYGARLLIDAHLGLTRGSWMLEAWGRNLGNDRYVRFVGPRGANFYPNMPRPLDLIHGDGRRWGLSVQYRSAAPGAR